MATSDHVLVARHDNEISTTTDVDQHPEFADRRTTKQVDGASVTGWFTEDFTLSELKTLRTKERIPAIRPGNVAYDGECDIPTLHEIIELAKRSGRRVGIYPETKHPTYFASIGLPLEEPLVSLLHRSGYRGGNASVFIQSFEVANLKALREMTKLPLVQLLSERGTPYDFTVAGDPRTYADLATPEGLREIGQYADAVGPNKELVIPRSADDTLAEPTDFVANAHAADLVVHPYTFRRENRFLPAEFRSSDDPNAYGDLAGELRTYLATGIDGFFTDHPDIGAAARDAALVERRRS